MERPAKAAFDNARARGLKGNMLLPFRRAMSREAEIMLAMRKCEVITANIQQLQANVEKLQADGVPAPYLIRVMERGRERPIDVRDLLKSLSAQYVREMAKIKS